MFAVHLGRGTLCERAHCVHRVGLVHHRAAARTRPRCAPVLAGCLATRFLGRPVVRRCRRQILEEVPLSPTYLAQRLAPSFQEQGASPSEATALASELLSQLSLEIGHCFALPHADRGGRLDGLMDLSPACGPREFRRRLHQALASMVRWYLHDPAVHLSDIRVGASSQELRTAASNAIERKRSLRRRCQSSVAYSTSPPSLESLEGEEIEEFADVDAAAVHGLKQWSKAFKEWCVEAVRNYFLLDPSLRSRWLTGRREERSRVSVLTHELRRLATRRFAQGLPRLGEEQWAALVQRAAQDVLVHRPKLLDVGSCTNYFGRLYGNILDVTALDLAPGHPSVLPCNFLELRIGPGEQDLGLQGLNGDRPALEQPASHFDVVIMSLLFSVLPSPEARGIAAAKARRLLKGSGHGLLIVADTKGTVGTHRKNRSSAWVQAVEANGFQLASDPQMHLSKEQVKGRNGYWQRSFCWSFWTSHCPREPVPIPLLSDDRKPRALSAERLQAQQLRDEKRRLRSRKAELLKQAKAARRVAEVVAKVGVAAPSLPGSCLCLACLLSYKRPAACSCTVLVHV